MSPKRTVVTGASGFIGANLTRRLVGAGHEVHAFVRPASRRWRLDPISSDVIVHELDLRDRVAVDRAFAIARPEWIFHLAAHGGSSWQTSMRDIIESNVLGTLNVIESSLVLGFDALVHAGSSSEYGFKDHAPAETDWLEPNSAYAVGKASATLLGRFVARSAGCKILTLRLYSAFGPWEEPKRLMPTLLLRALDRTWPPFVNPASARDYVYVDDVIDAFVRAAAAPPDTAGEIFNVGTGVQTTLKDLVDLVARLLGVPVEPRWGAMEDRVWDTGVWVSDSRHANAVLGWQPRTTLEQGVRTFVEWFAENPGIRRQYLEWLS